MKLQEVHHLVRKLISDNQLAQAENVCRQVLAQKADEPTTRDLLGWILLHLSIDDACQRKLASAEKKLMEAALFRPDDPSIHNNLGGLRISQRRVEEALAPLQRALELKPDYVDALANLGLVHLEMGQPEKSIEMYKLAVQAAETIPPPNPEIATAQYRLGNAFRVFGKLDEAVAEYRKTIQINPNLAEAWTALLYTMNLLEGGSGDAIFESHRKFDVKFSIGKTRPSINLSGQRRIRVGFVSPDFKEHAIVRFFPAVLGLDRSRFEVFCYASVSQPDHITEQLKKQCDAWRDIVAMNDTDAAALIEKDQIDVLIDLSGHMSSNRLRIFTHRPAPLQMSWLGYPNTTGLSCIDYRVTDSFADPPGLTEHLHSEKLWRLDPCFLCYQPIEETPEVCEPPSMNGGPITFGSFNDFAKIRPVTIALWAGVLRAVPNSRLMLKAKQLASQWARDRLIAAFEKEGIFADRLILVARDPTLREHFEKYSRVDIALDTYPYHGTTTSCDALWMGVPMVSLAGKTHVSRVGVSLLHAVGLAELAVDSPEEFARVAAELAMDSSRLREIRLSLRNRLKSSPLGNPHAFAQRFGEMLIEAIGSVQRI